MASASRFCLLLVEDNPGDAYIAQVGLAEIPETAFEVVSTTHLSHALRVLTSRPVDGVILDLNLPDSAGIATLKALRAAKEDVAIVVLSGDESSELRHQAIAEGAYDFIYKSEPTARLLARSVLYALERQRVQTLHRQIERLVAANPDGVIVLDGTHAVRFMNQAAEELFGIQKEKFIGDHLGFSIRENEAQDVEIVRGGEVRHAEIRVAAIEWAGDPGLLASIRDVTEQRKLADQLRQAQKLEAVGLLASGVAHDFNNLLVVIMACADLIADAAAEGGQPQPPAGKSIADIAEELLQVSERARALTTQLLVFSGQRPVHPSIIDLNEAAFGIFKLLRRTLPESIEIVILPCEGIWPVLIDAGQLGQVILNMAVNARDAMDRGGHLTIELANVRLPSATGTLPAGDYAAMHIADNGSGIPTAQLEEIFEPFFTTKAPGKGTGLGLATCRGIVRQANGDIIVDSVVGRGTTFSIYLPRTAQQAEKKEKSADVEQRTTGHESILIVEDDLAVSRLTGVILQKGGYRVATAGNGEEAKRMLESAAARFDLVVTDIVMPQMGGHELVDYIDRVHPAIKVLLMSGYTEDVLSRTLTQGHGRIILHKPFMPRELLARVRQALDQT